MKKYISLVLISTTLILSSCSIDWTGENEKKIIELEKQAQNDIFKKKQECANYTEEIKNAIQIGNSSADEKKFVKIFYSPKLNTCILWEQTYIYKDLSSDVLIDYLANKDPFSDSYIIQREYCKDFSKQYNKGFGAGTPLTKEEQEEKNTESEQYKDCLKSFGNFQDKLNELLGE